MARLSDTLDDCAALVLDAYLGHDRAFQIGSSQSFKANWTSVPSLPIAILYSRPGIKNHMEISITYVMTGIVLIYVSSLN